MIEVMITEVVFWCLGHILEPHQALASGDSNTMPWPHTAGQDLAIVGSLSSIVVFVDTTRVLVLALVMTAETTTLQAEA